MSDQQAVDSITIKCYSPDGFDLLVCLRGRNGELMPRALAALAWLKEHEFTPTRAGGQAQGNGAAQNGAAPNCPTHGTPMKASKHGGFFCPQKIADDDGTGKPVYCKQKIR